MTCFSRVRHKMSTQKRIGVFVAIFYLCFVNFVTKGANVLSPGSWDRTGQVKSSLSDPRASLKNRGATFKNASKSVIQSFENTSGVSYLSQELQPAKIIGLCPLNLAQFDELLWKMFLLYNFYRTEKEARTYCQNYISYAQTLTEFASNVHCIKGSKVVLRTFIKIAVNSQNRTAARFCGGLAKNYSQWRPHLKKFATNVSVLLDASKLFAERLVNDIRLKSRDKFERFVCMTVDLEGRLMALAEALEAEDAKNYARDVFRVMGPINHYIQSMLGSQCAPFVYPAVAGVRLLYKTAILPALTLVGGAEFVVFSNLVGTESSENTGSSRPKTSKPGAKTVKPGGKKRSKF